jgi:hypothetical protein
MPMQIPLNAEGNCGVAAPPFLILLLASFALGYGTGAPFLIFFTSIICTRTDGTGAICLHQPWIWLYGHKQGEANDD